MLGGCAGTDEGDGFDCYGNPVKENDPRTRRLTGIEQTDVWRRLRLQDPQRYTFEEAAHIRAGTFGIEGLTLYRQQTGANGTHELDTVTTTGARWELAILAGLFLLVVGNAVRPLTKHERGA